MDKVISHDTAPAHRLHPNHLEMFARLGIAPELLERAGIKTVSDHEARTQYGFSGSGDRSGILFPYHDPISGIRHTARLRRDRPDVEGGKPKKKYLSPYGDRRHLYFVPGCGDYLKDPAIPVLLVEAEKSALAITAWAERTGEKILPVGLGGVWAWRGRIGKAANAAGERIDEVGPLPELGICANRRKVYVLLDANANSNATVQQARDALARQLRKQRADVHILELPAGEDINGPDDYLAACGDEALRNLFAAANSGAALLGKIESFIRRYVVAQPAELVLVAVWLLHSHMMEVARTTPYLAITSAEKQSGKSRLLEVLELLVHKPWMTGRVTAACLTRKIDAVRPTLLLDESDAAFNGDREYAEALRGILNSGYRFNGVASCCVGQGANITYKDFRTFCAKAIAGIGKLPDTVADRSIPIKLKRRAPGEHVEDFDSDDLEDEVKALRKAIADWVASNRKLVGSIVPARLEGVSDRRRQVMRPLLAIADAAGANWPDRVQQAALEVFAGQSAEDQSISVQLLGDIKSAFDSKGVDRISSEDLVSALIAMEERPWGEFGKAGKPISKNTLANLLRKRYEISPSSVRIGDRTPRGYLLEWFSDAFSRYLPQEVPSEVQQMQQVNVYAGPGHFSEVQQEGSVAPAKSEESSMFMRVVADVALQNPVTGEDTAKTQRKERITL